MRKFLLIPFMTMLCSVMTFGGTITVGDGGDHATLSEALTAASAGDEIQLLEDVTLDANITISKAITLNLNSHMISGEDKYLTVGAYDITLCNGTLFNSYTGNRDVEHSLALGVNTGSLHIVTLHDIELIAGNPIIIKEASSNVVFGNNVTLTTNFEGNSAATGKKQIYCHQNANFTISEGATMNFSFQTPTKKTISLTNYGTLTIGATFGNNSKFSTVTNSGNLTITANCTETTLTNTGTMTIAGGVYNGATIVNNGSATITNAEFSAAASTFSGDNNTLITGGTFNVAPAGTKGYIEPVTNCTFVEGVGELTIADGYVWRESDGLIVVAPPTTVAATLKHLGGSQNYSYVEEAFNAAVSGDTIILMDDYTTSSIITIGTSNVSDASRTLVFDLNGHTLTSASSVERTILLMHGKLYVINSVPGQGGIVNTHASGKTFFIQGTYQKSCNSRTAAISDLFTYLYVGDGVAIDATGDEGSSIVVDVVRNKTYGNEYLTKYINKSTGNAVNNGLANGVRVDVKGNVHANKYAIKMNGYVSYPNPDIYSRANDDSESTVAESDTIYSTFIHVYPSANVTVPNNVQEAAPIYTGGYGRILMEGKCQGATGLYMKSGFVVLNNAIVESTWKGNAVVVKGLESGIKAGGNAIVVESDATVAGYPGHAVLIVNGDTKAQTSATGGAALVDAVNTTGNSTIDKVTINGGTFIGDYAIVISEQTAESADAEVVIHGVSLVGDVEVAQETGVAAVNSIIDLSAVHTTVLDNGSKTTIIVSAGSNSPIEITNFGTSADPQEDEIVDIAEQQDRPDANWTGTNPGEVSEGTTVALGELHIISGTEEHPQELTVEDDATLNVERLIMNENAKITVQPGGTLIVEGKQGINAPDVENITLQSSEEKQAIFLFHPEVSSNRHPMATVQMISKAYRKEDGKYVYQRFGVPSYMDGITRADMHYTSPTAVYKLNYESQQWESMAMTDEFIPFQCYELTTTDAAPGAVYTFQCPLTGNSDAELVLQDKWNYYANSYSAPINIKQMINRFAEDNADAVDPTVYVYDPELDWWKAVNNGNLWRSGTPKEIAPMQAFIFKRVGNGENPNISYNEHVWTPIVDPSNVQFAPSRNRNNMSTAIIEIQDANGKKDVVTLMEGNQFSEDYDLTYDATKYINTRSFNFYVAAEEPMEMVATDNLEGNVLNLTTKDQTSFTMTFREVNGMEYAIRDMLTGTETAIVEGATYMFSTAANSTVEGRFVIVPVAKMPTAIEHIEATAATKGIYTISGQFVGYDYHALPMGVYVVDGKKIVK